MEFNITRFGNLIKRDFITHRKAMMYGMLSVVGFLLLVYAFTRIFEDGNETNAEFWKQVYLAFIFIVGLTFTSLVFREFKSPAGRLQFLSLPASNLEKLGSRWLYSLILFPAFITLCVWIMSLVSIEKGPGLFSSFDKGNAGWLFLAFLLAHATMFLYATWFNNLVAIKGTLVGFMSSLIFGLLCLATFWIIFNDFFEHGLREGPSIHANMSASGQEFFRTKIDPLAKFLLKFFVVPFLWVVSYFKIKEKEA